MTLKIYLDYRVITDWATNQILRLRSWLRTKGIFLGKPKKLNIFLSKCELKIDDNFKNYSNWNLGYWWGQFHGDPGNKWWVNNKKNTKLVKNGLELNTSHDPTIDPIFNIQRNYSTGVVESKDTFWYGYFEVSATVERGKDLWHAPLWVVSKGNPDGSEFDPVVPEFDASEFYSDPDGTNAHSNSDCHYGATYKEGKSLGAMTHYLKDPYNRNIKYGFVWDKDRLEVYYEGYRVRLITRKDVISRFTKKLMVIIGSGVKNHKTIKEDRAMIIHNFKYYSRLIF